MCVRVCVCILRMKTPVNNNNKSTIEMMIKTITMQYIGQLHEKVVHDCVDYNWY